MARIDMLGTKDTAALHMVTAVGSIDIVGYLLEDQHVNRKARTSLGVTALMCAATTGRPKIVEILIAHDAPVDETVENATDPVENETTLAHFAACCR